MAWTDAARAAALEARRRHAKMRPQGQQIGKSIQWGGSLYGHKDFRNKLAHSIKRMRRGIEPMTTTPFLDARASTAFRNKFRRK